MRNITYISIMCLLILLSSVGHADVAGIKLKQVGNGKAALTWRFTYDDAGRITKLIDPAGRETKIHYDLDNNKRVRLIRKELPDGSKVAYNFDKFGRRVSMTDSGGTVRYKYDGFSRLIEVHRDDQSPISYTYDTMDRLKSISVGKWLTMSYSYDFLGRLAEINTPAGTISYEYQTGQGMVIRTLPNGIRTIWEYEPDGSLQSISHAAKDNRLLAQFTYSYRPDGLISASKEYDPQGGRFLRYEYDKVQRLISVKDSRHGEVKYVYDKFGNRTELVVNGQSVTSEYDWAGRMVTYKRCNCIHDAAGNLTDYIGKNGKNIFEYNAANLLKSASMGKGKVEYCYDGDGYIIARTINGKKTSFIPDPLTDTWSPLLATNAVGKHLLYVWEGDSPVAAIEDGKARFFLHNHLGSVRCVVDQHGKIIERCYYTPFGMPQQEFVDGDLRPGFAGLFFDPKASFYLTRARAYDPRLARFLQRDPQPRIPLDSQKDLSAYAYCGCDSVNFIDVTGFRAERPGQLSWLSRVGGILKRALTPQVSVSHAFLARGESQTLLEASPSYAVMRMYRAF